jgi:hypothetical protein
VVTPRARMAELAGSLTLAAILAAAATMLWAALTQGNVDYAVLEQQCFLTIATCWSVLVPSKFWTSRGDSGTRRAVMLACGLLVGLGALWIDGWSPRVPFFHNGHGVRTASLAPGLESDAFSVPNMAGHLSYFALAFFALRWWKLTDRRRNHRFSLAPIVAAAFWGLVLLLVWHEPWRGTLVLTTAAAIVQLVSPWEQPPPPVARRMRLRYA